MTTTNIVLYHRPNKDGKNPLAIRITKDRKSSYVFLGQAIDRKHWDKVNKKVRRSHPNSGRLNAFLIKKLADVNKTYLGRELEDEVSSAQDIHKAFIEPASENSFFAEADIYLEVLRKEGKYNRYVTDKPRIKRFEEFTKSRGLRFEEVDLTILKNFKAWLKGSKKVSERTAINYLLVIRTIYNQAIRKGIVDQKHYPFGKGGISIKFPESKKIGLTKEEINKLRAQDLTEEPKLHHSLNLWLTAFYLAGMRASDVLRLRWNDIKDGRLYYTMGKNNKTGSLKLPEPVELIFQEYHVLKRSEEDVIFPELKMIDDFDDTYLIQRKISYGVKTANKWLKVLATKIKLNKPLTMHIARHSFAGISGDKIPIQLLQKLYRHTSITTTIEYQKSFTNKDLDDAFSSVIDF